MADPKYADLPGIAHDEPDIYETTDLPESDQSTDFFEEENEIVERIHINAADALEKFKGKFLKSENVDFSDRLGKRIRTGYDARSGDWDLVARGEHESILQKYQRLQCELGELQGDIMKIKASKSEKTVDALVTENQVEQALKLLSDLKLEQVLGSDFLSTVSDPQGAQMKKLLAQLELFKSAADESPESQKESDGSTITYQLNYKPEQAKLAQTGRVAELESRLRRLETVLGSSGEKYARLASGSTKGSLLETSQYLCATASLLDVSQLDHIEGRLISLQQKLDAIAEKKSSLAGDEEKDKMILELYELVKNSGKINEVLPQTIEHLKALEGLHQKTSDFAQTLEQIEVMQAKITSNVDNNKTLLQGVQESFAESLTKLNQTIADLDTRMKALKKK